MACPPAWPSTSTRRSLRRNVRISSITAPVSASRATSCTSAKASTETSRHASNLGLRSLSDSAQALVLAQEQAQRSTTLTLVAEVANAWWSLAAD